MGRSGRVALAYNRRMSYEESCDTGTRRTCTVNSHDVMKAARSMTERGHWRSTQARLRRAVNTGYHAVRHCSAAAVANLLVGGFGASG